MSGSRGLAKAGVVPRGSDFASQLTVGTSTGSSIVTEITKLKLSFECDQSVQRRGHIRLSLLSLVALTASCLGYHQDPITAERAAYPATMDAVTASIDYRRLESEVLRELNAVREDPPGYSAHLSELLPLFNGNVMRRPDRSGALRTTEGADAVRQAIGALQAQSPLPTLVFAKGLAEAARDLAAEQAKSGNTGHTGTDGSSPADRLARYGSWSTSYAENIAYGSFATGRDVVIDLLIDDGVPDRGHRRNIFDPTARVVGVACGRHSKFGSVCVIDQAGGFTPR